MVTGVIIVLCVLVVGTAFGLWRGRRDGVVRSARAPDTSGDAVDDRPILAGADIGGELGAQATLVQFSSAFCQPCRAARGTLAHVAGSVEGVEHVEVDAEHHLDLVRRLNISRTPTTLILNGDGRVIGRATGVPRVADVRATLDRI